MTADTLSGSGPSQARLVLRHGVLAGGQSADVAIDQVTGRIVQVGDVPPMVDDVVEDCTGLTVVPSGVEVHAHLDKALTSNSSAMPVDLVSAVEDWLALAPTLGGADYIHRAIRAVEAMVARGTTTIRTHVDLGGAMGLTAVRAMITVREHIRQRGLADIEIVGLVSPPFRGDSSDPHRRLLDEAIEAGVDVVGGSPDLDPNPLRATTAAVEAAAAAALPIDLHTDQNVDPDRFFLPAYVDLVERHGVTRAAASHCISLAAQPPKVQEQTAKNIARSGMSVFTMPLTSAFYFGWDVRQNPPRGVTAIHALLEAGVTVAAGADNARDLFFPLGRFDQFEVASALAMVAHLTPEQAWDMCSAAPRKALELPEVKVAAGYPAEIVAIAGPNLSQAVAAASENRLVVHRGRVVSRTNIHQQLTC